MKGNGRGLAEHQKHRDLGTRNPTEYGSDQNQWIHRNLPECASVGWRRLLDQTIETHCGGPLSPTDAGCPASGTWRQREAALQRIDEVGRRKWRKESGAHQQARAENGMFRYKRIIGDRLRSRSSEGQRIEALIGVNILNRMTVLGMPGSVSIQH
jgi:hypothetical protein